MRDKITVWGGGQNMTAAMLEIFEAFRIKNMDELGFGPKAMKSIKVCKECGKVSSDKQTICKECGASLPAESVYQEYKKMHLHCSCCDTVVPNNAHYCPQCGRNLEKSS